MKRPREISPAILDAARCRRPRPPPTGKSQYRRFLDFLDYVPPEQPAITIIVDSDGRCQGSFAPGRKKGDEPR
jgi:hypothetical protein